MSEATLREQIETQLKTVFDPEIPVNIWELGLVYEVKIKENNRIGIDMTLTAPGCPVAGDIIREVDEKIRNIEGVSDVDVHLTFDPPWTKEMMSEEAKLELGFL
jgi:FeS assembly SUF system protein